MGDCPVSHEKCQVCGAPSDVQVHPCQHCQGAMHILEQWVPLHPCFGIHAAAGIAGKSSRPHILLAPESHYTSPALEVLAGT